MTQKTNLVFALLLVLTTFFSCTSDDSVDPENTENDNPKSAHFSVELKLDTLNFEWAYLAYFEDGKFVYVDSSKVNSGKCAFNGTLESPRLHYITFKDTYDRIELFLDHSTVTISGQSLIDSELKIEGSELNDTYLAFKEEDDRFDAEIGDIIGLYDEAEQAGDEVKIAYADSLYNEIDSLRGIFIKKYIVEHPTSFVGAYVLVNNTYRYDLEELETFYGNFSEEIIHSAYGERVNKTITALKNSSIGNAAPQFTMNDQDENPVVLKEFQGNYLLLDFWASWCGPCRAENPNVVDAYKKYHPMGLEILGVSLDNKKENWLTAIADDGLSWKHVSELNGWKSTAVDLYAVSSIPHSVLIDENGIIVAKNLRGDDLQNKLAEIYAK